MKNRYTTAIISAIVATFFAYKYPAEFFILFTAGWLFTIPIAFAGYLVYGLLQYKKDQKNQIDVRIKPTAAMRAIARRQFELQKEKEYIIKNEL